MLTAGLSWREVTLLRTYAKYMRQGGIRFSEDYMPGGLMRSNASITRLLVRLFASRLDPARQGGATERCEAITEEIRGQLDEVTSLDHDRILRTYLALINATLRTNFYGRPRRGKSARAVVQARSRRIARLTPRPQFEIFVYSPRLEGVHLRFGGSRAVGCAGRTGAGLPHRDTRAW